MSLWRLPGLTYRSRTPPSVFCALSNAALLTLGAGVKAANHSPIVTSNINILFILFTPVRLKLDLGIALFWSGREALLAPSGILAGQRTGLSGSNRRMLDPLSA